MDNSEKEAETIAAQDQIEEQTDQKQQEEVAKNSEVETAPNGETGKKIEMDEERDPYVDENGRKLTDEEVETVGTDKQTVIIKDYPTQNVKDKLKVPYFMKQNGNICIKQAQKQAVNKEATEAKNGTSEKEQNEDKSKQASSTVEANGDTETRDKGAIDPYQKALHYYNQSLLSLKMIFEDQSNDMEQSVAIDLIKNVEVPVCLNLALCYLKTEKYHYAIKYCSQVLDKNLKAEQIQGGVASIEKAHYRRGQCYFKIGDLKKAKADYTRASEVIEEAQKQNPNIKKSPVVAQALRDLKAKQDDNKKKERELSMRMLNQRENQTGTVTTMKSSIEVKRDYDKDPVFENKIAQLSFDILFLIYADLHKKLNALLQYLLAILFSITFLNIGSKLSDIWTSLMTHVFIVYLIQAFQPDNVKYCCAQVVEKRLGAKAVEAEKKETSDKPETKKDK